MTEISYYENNENEKISNIQQWKLILVKNERKKGGGNAHYKNSVRGF